MGWKGAQRSAAQRSMQSMLHRASQRTNMQPAATVPAPAYCNQRQSSSTAAPTAALVVNQLLDLLDAPLVLDDCRTAHTQHTLDRWVCGQCLVQRRD